MNNIIVGSCVNCEHDSSGLLYFAVYLQFPVTLRYNFTGLYKHYDILLGHHLWVRGNYAILFHM